MYLVEGDGLLCNICMQPPPADAAGPADSNLDSDPEGNTEDGVEDGGSEGAGAGSGDDGSDDGSDGSNAGGDVDDVDSEAEVDESRDMLAEICQCGGWWFRDRDRWLCLHCHRAKRIVQRAATRPGALDAHSA